MPPAMVDEDYARGGKHRPPPEALIPRLKGLHPQASDANERNYRQLIVWVCFLSSLSPMLT